MENKKIKKILIYRPEHIGDYIVSLPAIRTLRENYPKAEISLVVGPWNKTLAEVTPYVDRRIIFEDPFVERGIKYSQMLLKGFSNYKKFKRFFSQLGKDYDLLVVFSGRKFTKLIIPFFKAKQKLCGVYLKKNGELEINRCLKVISPLGLKKFKNASFKQTKKDIEKVQEVLKGTGQDKIKVAIHLYTPLNEKDWPVEKWGALIKDLSSKNFHFFVIGSETQREKVEEFAKKFKGEVTNLAGKLDLVQLAHFIKKCDLFIGPSSGPMHIAEMTDTPVILLIGDESPPEWETHKKKSKTLRRSHTSKIPLEEVLYNINKVLHKK